jgi:Putative Ig domain
MAADGHITGTISGGANATYNPVYHATNAAGGPVNMTYVWNITNVPAPPAWAPIADQENIQGQAISPLDVSIVVSGDVPITYAVVAPLPTGLTLVGSIISGTPTVQGVFNPIISATNSAGGPINSPAFTWTILPPLAAPTWPTPIPDQSSVEDSAITPLNVSGNATGNPAPTFTAVALPAGLFVSTAGVVTGTPTTPGTTTATIRASNSQGQADDSFQWTITAAGVPPTLANLPIRSDRVGASVSVNFNQYVTAGDPPLTWTFTNLPTGLNGNVNTGVVTGTPLTVSAPVVTVAVANSHGSDSDTFLWQIGAALNPPLLNLPASASYAESAGALSLSLVSYNTGGSATSWSIVSSGGLPGVAISNGGQLTVDVTVAEGSYVLVIRATNADGSSDDSIQFTVTSSNPVVQALVGPRVNYIGDSANIAMSGFISGATSWSATGLPPNATINTSSGLITGTLVGPQNVHNPVVTATNIHGYVTTTWQWSIQDVPVEGEKRQGRVT